MRYQNTPNVSVPNREALHEPHHPTGSDGVGATIVARRRRPPPPPLPLPLPLPLCSPTRCRRPCFERIVFQSGNC